MQGIVAVLLDLLDLTFNFIKMALSPYIINGSSQTTSYVPFSYGDKVYIYYQQYSDSYWASFYVYYETE